MNLTVRTHPLALRKVTLARDAATNDTEEMGVDDEVLARPTLEKLQSLEQEVRPSDDMYKFVYFIK